VVQTKKAETGRRDPDTVRYRLVRKVAEGGMGAVYEAILRGPEGFGKVVALKTIRQDLTRDPAFVRMFIGEAKLVADLVHQNIVQIYHLGLVNDLYYMAMEFVDGVHLGEFMARHQELGRPLPVDLAIYVISRVCRGLEYAHRSTTRRAPTSASSTATSPRRT
jgi:serine/threonine-protein kinase